MSFTTWALALTVLCAIWYRTHRKYYTYFAQRNIPYQLPIYPLGNITAVVFRTQSLYGLLMASYKRFKGESFYGFYRGVQPIVFVRDPKLIQKITLQDFDHFVDLQPLLSDPSIEPMIGRSLFTLKGDAWHDMRTTLSPAFASSRMAGVFQLALASSRRAAERLHGRPTKLKDVLSRYVSDVTASVTFGIEINSFEDTDNRFYRIALQALDFTSVRIRIKFFVTGLMHKMSAPFKMRWYSDEVVEHFSSLVLNTIATRNINNIRRPDIIQALLDAQRRYSERNADEAAEQQSTPSAELGSEDFRGVRQRQWDNEELISQCFMLFLTGYIMTTASLEFVVYELMSNPDVQRRLIGEIDAFRSGPDGVREMQYNDLHKLKYLDMVISETMRKWPIASRLQRKCVKDYVLQDGRGNSMTLHAGDNVWMPIVGLHMDPDYFPDPHTFDPERFSDERKHLIKPFTFLPFGAGPRECIGSRFALMQMKVFVYHLLSCYTLHQTPSTSPMKIRTGMLFQMHDFDMGLLPRT